MVTLLALLVATAAVPSALSPQPAEQTGGGSPVSSFDEPLPDPDRSVISEEAAATPAPRGPTSGLRIEASETGAELSVSAAGPGWSRTCAALVTVDRPCLLAPAPKGQIVDLQISGTRTFDSKVFLGEASTTVVIEHRGYARTVAGLVAMGVAVVILRVGVSAAERGDASTARTVVTIGASLEAVGLLAILADLSSTHNHAVVVP